MFRVFLSSFSCYLFFPSFVFHSIRVVVLLVFVCFCCGCFAVIVFVPRIACIILSSFFVFFISCCCFYYRDFAVRDLVFITIFHFVNILLFLPHRHRCYYVYHHYLPLFHPFPHGGEFDSLNRVYISQELILKPSSLRRSFPIVTRLR